MEDQVNEKFKYLKAEFIAYNQTPSESFHESLMITLNEFITLYEKTGTNPSCVKG